MNEHLSAETCHITFAGKPLCERMNFVVNIMQQAASREVGFPVVCQYSDRSHGQKAADAIAKRYQPGLVQLVEGACPHECSRPQ